ncbi:uncharacterized protein PHALS_04368 [Plasmopara halstedii]|uniref:Uncharacterized protein n=1 Tax=Plasmopara halstedii TaxID=4781 RepID=A0A0P1B044_PLAHL|nr:uncharacterized protein PHALS_04368 [Plasmopara halstedii]CEG47497.1 hypothetical protein PHALS_04368 [Plasmopara halstedii]|eukprot:XP_024583866.1 hypothetical protein PHALS_04368 [Plasmopara halstedii]
MLIHDTLYILNSELDNEQNFEACTGGKYRKKKKATCRSDGFGASKRSCNIGRVPNLNSVTKSYQRVNSTSPTEQIYQMTLSNDGAAYREVSSAMLSCC